MRTLLDIHRDRLKHVDLLDEAMVIGAVLTLIVPLVFFVFRVLG